MLIWQQGCDPAAADAALLALIAALQAAAFRFASFKSKRKPPLRLTRIDIGRRGKLPELDATLASSGGNNLARWLTALPPNYLDARKYRRFAQEFARHLRLGFKFYGEPQLRRLGRRRVSRRRQRQCHARCRYRIYLSYRPRGAAAAAPAAVSLVGKGICFDTGGTNLKPHKSMLDMHTDMEGSAVALGSLYALHYLRSPLAGRLLAGDHRESHRSDRLQTARRGARPERHHHPSDPHRRRRAHGARRHVESRGHQEASCHHRLCHPDRRLRLCAHRTLQRRVHQSPRDARVIEPQAASSGERVWCFPMDADFDTDIDSSVADVQQCPVEGRGDHILAARFLNRFVPADIPWLHLDLAAGTRHGGLAHITTDITGFGVRYTLELLRRGWPQTGKS
jgi:leucyl aminopeptidase